MNSFEKKKIWDPVTRMWHWILVFTVATGWGLGKFMTLSNVSWHFYLGYLALGLLLFRLIWGIVGPAPVRFTSLFFTPASLIRYSKTLFLRSPSGTAGHNPMGSLWIMIILLLLTAQGISGLFCDADDFFEYGPLHGSVTEGTAKLLNAWHYYLSNIILAMVVLHVSIIMFYLVWKKENLVIGMITGKKWVKVEEKNS